MPLVDSQATGDKNVEWQNKLVGKTLHEEETTETVSSLADERELRTYPRPGLTRDLCRHSPRRNYQRSTASSNLAR